MTETQNDELNHEQQDTANLLERVLGRAIADRYVDFCRLASGVLNLRVSRPVAAHALRELDSMLRDALAVPMEVKADECSIDPKRLARARVALEELGFEGATAAKAVDSLRPRVTHPNAIRQISARLGLAPDGDIAKAWLKLTATSGKAHERSFLRSLVVDDEFRHEFQRPFDMVIRAVALALQRRYSALTGRVEEIAAMTDKGYAVSLFANEIPGAMPLQWHFYERLHTADWLPHLVRKKLTGAPRSESSAGGVGLFREWPVGSYLQRMAKSLDTDVRRQVIAAVRGVASSKHPDVSRGGLEVIATLPATEAASLADVTSEWIDRDATFMSIQEAEQLVRKLANEGEDAAALNVAERLLQVFGNDGDVASLYAQHMYEYSLPQLAPLLTQACGIGALELLADLLHQVIMLHNERNQDHTFDRTTYDQGALVDDTIGIYSVYDALRTEVRRAAELLVSADPALMPAIMDVFGKYTPRLFRRLELATLSLNPKMLPERATAALLDAELLEASWCTHEYAGLACAWFPSMSAPDQQSVLDLADAIPSRYIDGWRARFEEHEKRPPNAEDERVYSAHVLRDALWYWRMMLPTDRQSAVEAVGDPDAWKHRHKAGQDESPIAAADFAARTPAEIAGFLRTWRSDEQPRRQTVSALSLELRNVAAQNPAKYAAAAMEFSDLPATYVHRLLEGLGEAARNQRDFPWSEVLCLLDATFARWQQSVDEGSVAEGNDPNWQWACAAGVELLKAGLQRGASGLPFAHKPAVQTLILALRRRAPQDPEHEDFEQQFDRDPYFAAESTLRGSALELCVLLMFWLSKEEGTTLADTPHAALDLTPEIRDVLDAELADQTASGRVPRAILGRYLRWLFYFGETWLTMNVGTIFPASDEHLRQAAWLGHLLHDQGPLGEVLPMLEQDYAHAIDRLGEQATDRGEHREKSLANHLLVLYFQGHLDLKPGGLVHGFLLKASPRLRQHVMWSLGVQLKYPLDQFPEAMRTRALNYWDSRLAAGEMAQDRAAFKGELGSIGQWCENHQLDPDWLFDQMLRMLRSGFAPSSAYSVVEWLAKISASHADRALEVLEALVTNPGVDHYMGQEQSIRTVLSVGHAIGTPATIKRVGEVVSYLASIGQTGYLDVIRPK